MRSRRLTLNQSIDAFGLGPSTDAFGLGPSIVRSHAFTRAHACTSERARARTYALVSMCASGHSCACAHAHAGCTAQVLSSQKKYEPLPAHPFLLAQSLISDRKTCVPKHVPRPVLRHVLELSCVRVDTPRSCKCVTRSTLHMHAHAYRRAPTHAARYTCMDMCMDMPADMPADTVPRALLARNRSVERKLSLASARFPFFARTCFRTAAYVPKDFSKHM